jgi:hypothetical protein
MTMRPMGIAYVLFALGANAQVASEYALENAKVRLALNGNGAVTQLVDKQSDARHNLIARPTPGFWSLIFHRGVSYENLVEPQLQRYRIERAGDRLTVTADKLRFRDETLDIKVTFEIRLQDDEVRWTARVENRAPVTIVDFYFPQLGGVDSLGDARRTDDLIWPRYAGMRVSNLKRSLGRAFSNPPGTDPLDLNEPINTYQNPSLEETYPAFASMSWYEFTNGKRGIYFGSHDSRFLTGALRVKRRFEVAGTLEFCFAKYLFTRQGEIWVSGEYVTSPHPGTWHTGASKYRKWADTWFRPRPRPQWMERMKGMFLVILRQQYGDVMWQYRELPALYEEARKGGMDTVALFGWTEAGHDHKYPEANPDPEMGGEAALREGLAGITKMGGKTLMYLNGFVMDASGEFFRQNERLAAKSLGGTPYFRTAGKQKWVESSFLRNFSWKAWAPVCSPGDPVWIETMLAAGRKLQGYGVTGVLYDQLGGLDPYPCFQNNAGVRESEAFVTGRLKLLDKLPTTLREGRPDSGFVAEHFTDVYSQYIDVLHGCCYGLRYEEGAFPQMSRYTFPEVISTARNPEPRTIRKHVNFALAYGYRFEVEVRYRPDMETIRRQEKAHLRDYQRKVSELRDRYWDLLGSGRFLDDRGLVNQNPSVTATVFSAGRRRAVVVWNNTTQPQPVRVDFPGAAFVEAAGIDGVARKRPELLKPQEVSVLIFE